MKEDEMIRATVALRSESQIEKDAAELVERCRRRRSTSKILTPYLNQACRDGEVEDVERLILALTKMVATSQQGWGDVLHICEESCEWPVAG